MQQKAEKKEETTGGEEEPMNGPALSLSSPLQVRLAADIGGFGGKRRQESQCGHFLDTLYIFFHKIRFFYNVAENKFFPHPCSLDLALLRFYLMALRANSLTKYRKGRMKKEDLFFPSQHFVLNSSSSNEAVSFVVVSTNPR